MPAREHLRLAALFGLSLAAMNFSIYQALDRIPLGVAVTLEFVGPLLVACWAHAARSMDSGCCWPRSGSSCCGRVGGEGVDAAGTAFALIAGAAWGAYILLSARVGSVFEGGSGLAIAMTFA